MSLDVHVISASSLPDVDRMGKSDPYVQITFLGQKRKTSVKDDCLDPEWDEHLIWEITGKAPNPDATLEINVKDEEKLGRNRLLGKSTIFLKNLLQGGTQDYNLKLVDKGQNATPGSLKVRIQYKPPKGGAAGSAGATGAAVAAGAGGDAVANAGGGAANTGSGQQQFMGMAGPRPRDLLPDKELKFQIRVKVIEARQLMGADLNPVCRVNVGTETKQTRIQKSTTSPYFDEIFFFYVSKTPSDLFDDTMEFTVCNSRVLRSNSVIGGFRCEVGFVYDQDKHAFLNKWLALSQLEEDTSGVQGYLKVSMAVMGPNDDCPNFKTEPGGEEDVESNLLYSSGVQLQPATFALGMFLAEDLPRMDAGAMQSMKKLLGVGEVSKELVDPYALFQFAGKEVQSKVMYTSDHPEFHQRLNLAFMFPSMCNDVRIILRDWDSVGEDDNIGTAIIKIPEISTAGEEGYLPTFGPCFVNFYGSTREFKAIDTDYDDDMNAGKISGCAYRGRSLITLKTEIGEYPACPTQPIEDEEVLKVEMFRRSRRYQIHCALIDATMIGEVDVPVEFEVSMGNFGNKFEDSVMPSPSSTQPTNAVFDGSKYYFLPWKESKPCVTIHCQWEDISHRLFTLNILLKTCKTLEKNIATLRTSIKADKPVEDLAIEFVAVMDRFIQDCRIPLPTPDEGFEMRNTLDSLLFGYRRQQIDKLITESLELKETATDVEEAVKTLDDFLRRIKALAIEPQNSMPDIIIWMISGKKRLAYSRVPAYTVLYGGDALRSGEDCGNLQTLLLEYPGKKKLKKVPAMLRMRIWLGKETEAAAWMQWNTDADLVVFAETYENQVSMAGNWITRGPTMTRPRFSDSEGDLALDKDSFKAPPGWKFEGDWFVNPEPSLFYEADAGRKVFLEDVFENENRVPGGSWMAALTHFTDVRGDPATPRDEMQCPAGWEWEDAWQVDMKRAVDEEGWEYCVEATMGGYGPVDKMYHLCRRRRWVRKRLLVQKAEKKEPPKGLAEGWEYAVLFNAKFHARERKLDMVRRRRWHKKMVPDTLDVPQSPVFTFQDKEDSSKTRMSCPKMYLHYTDSSKYQLRAYLYQARDLPAADKSGFSDPFACVAFLNRSQQTEKITQTICPTWDQTLLYDDIVIFGNQTIVQEQPPQVVIELFDQDDFGEPEFLGRTFATPVVHLNSAKAKPPSLQWYQLKRGTDNAGELLACFELYLKDDDLPFLPPRKKGSELYIVPSGIRPVLQRTAVEILCWGVRNMKTYELRPVRSPSVEFECSGTVVESVVIKDIRANPNFATPSLYFEIPLPKEPLYMPPLNMKVRDHRSFGSKPVVGTCSIRSLYQYRVEPVASHAGVKTAVSIHGSKKSAGNDSTIIEVEAEPEQPTVDETAVSVDQTASDDVDGSFNYAPLSSRPAKPESDVTEASTSPLVKKPPSPSAKQPDYDRITERQKQEPEKDIDWWSKYYASCGDEQKSGEYVKKGYEKLTVYETELERVDGFHGFSDFLDTFPLSRGKSKAMEESKVVGEFKGTFRVYSLPDDPTTPPPPKQIRGLPPATMEDVIVRVYIIRAFDLAPMDPNGLADPYIKIELGKEKKDSKKEYRPNTLNPFFGHCFELTATLPTQKDLTVSVYDRDLLSKDDLIGETFVDLENRYLTKHRATCGLAQEYHIAGPNQWRDGMKPKEILASICDVQHKPSPIWVNDTEVAIGTQRYRLDEMEEPCEERPNTLGPLDERLALKVLHTMPLVAEHVETRRLFNPSMPDMEQGKLQMWVDIFPSSAGTPGPEFDITPRRPSKFELRVVIYNIFDVIMDETNIMGEAMSDVYVKAWLQGTRKPQKTDVHYRCMDGEAMFNWRFVFPLEYLEAERMMVVRNKEHFWSLDEKEEHRPPKLMLQLWDNDLFSADDYLGEVELDLGCLIPPAKNAISCVLEMLDVVTKEEEEEETEREPLTATSILKGVQGAVNKYKITPFETTPVDLFDVKRSYGFWPTAGFDEGERILAGKIEMELEIVPEDEVEKKPAGLGREEPNMNPTLPPPNRPATSFLWFTSPWKTFKHIFWKNYKWYFITLLLIALLVAFVALVIYSVPGVAVEKVFGL